MDAPNRTGYESPFFSPSSSQTRDIQDETNSRSYESRNQTSRIGNLAKTILGAVLVVGVLVGSWKFLGQSALIFVAVTVLLGGYIAFRRKRASRYNPL